MPERSEERAWSFVIMALRSDCEDGAAFAVLSAFAIDEMIEYFFNRDMTIMVFAWLRF